MPEVTVSHRDICEERVSTVTAARQQKARPLSLKWPRSGRLTSQKTFPVAKNMIKPYFSERVNYRDKTGRMNTRTVRLKAVQIRELAPWIYKYALTDRYLLTGARHYSDRIEVSQAALQRLARLVQK